MTPPLSKHHASLTQQIMTTMTDAAWRGAASNVESVFFLWRVALPPPYTRKIGSRGTDCESHRMPRWRAYSHFYTRRVGPF